MYVIHRQPAGPRVQMAFFTVCPACKLIHAGDHTCCLLAPDDTALPSAPLIALILSAMLALAGAAVGLVWLAWG